jgi:hypothetical protein
MKLNCDREGTLAEYAIQYYRLTREKAMTIRTVNSNALLVLTAGLFACASAPVSDPPAEPVVAPPPQNLMATTDDLGMVTDIALQLADSHGKDQVLVVFDIDNTLLAMERDLGSDQWYYWQKDLQKEDPCSAMLASNRFAAQGALFFASAMRPTQPDGPEQVRRLQDAGLKVIAVTSRGPEYRLQTFRELRRNGISFWPSALPPQHGYPDDFIPAGGSRPSRYEDGVFLTAGQHKGEMLKALLNQSGTPWPKAVVIADDKAYSLHDMMETFKGSSTAVIAWRYSREDANVAAFDPEQAAARWNTARPALLEIQEIFGPVNFELPAQAGTGGCD